MRHQFYEQRCGLLWKMGDIPAAAVILSNLQCWCVAGGADVGGLAERWVGSVRRDLLDHVIVLNRKHLRRLLNEYVRYYHEDRTHLGLGKDTPGGRVAASPPSSGHKVISLPRLGGLHHRYTVAA